MRPLLSIITMVVAMTFYDPATAEIGLGGGDRLVGAEFATRAPAVGTNGMAATAHPLASQIAIDVLKRGGSAVDAAIAANAALGLMEPVGCGIGGDLFAIVWDPKTKTLHGLNASGRSPRGRSLEELKAKLGERTSIPAVGTLPVTVPGAVDGWFELHARFGKLDMADVLAPAIGYAKDGFPMAQLIAYYWDRNMAILEKRYTDGQIEEFDNARATYLVDGQAPQEGEIFKNPDLARTYERLANEGREVFYEGEIARTIDAYMNALGVTCGLKTSRPMKANGWSRSPPLIAGMTSTNYRRTPKAWPRCRCCEFSKDTICEPWAPDRPKHCIL